MSPKPTYVNDYINDSTHRYLERERNHQRLVLATVAVAGWAVPLAVAYVMGWL